MLILIVIKVMEINKIQIKNLKNDMKKEVLFLLFN